MHIAISLTHIINLSISRDNQYSFRRNHSTSLALVDLYDIISLALDRNGVWAGVFIDLSKAFDTAWIITFFSDKLQHCGVKVLESDWVKSYFYQRSQFVEYNGHRSPSEVIPCGVPRGSILHHIRHWLWWHFSTRIYFIAHDTNLFISEKDPVTLNNILHSELNKLSASEFPANKLSL